FQAPLAIPSTASAEPGHAGPTIPSTHTPALRPQTVVDGHVANRVACGPVARLRARTCTAVVAAYRHGGTEYPRRMAQLGSLNAIVIVEPRHNSAQFRSR